ncbi:serine--tRNA ligase [Striga asiatica]|uniref:Serine--tRNA ligase n=1 Tax=Striga asiatica TaxID=4170 RepID=A0A5A7Q8P1_STRAF|nr:serine--tRNA ligase [Striga asiatica]
MILVISGITFFVWDLILKADVIAHGCAQSVADVGETAVDVTLSDENQESVDLLWEKDGCSKIGEESAFITVVAKKTMEWFRHVTSTNKGEEQRRKNHILKNKKDEAAADF